jgi:predicted anti-sigma-YlaC factor YlaD
MEIEPHLSDEQLIGLLMGEAQTSKHLIDCQQCRGDYSALQSQFSALPEGVRNATDLPQVFWQRQAAAIRSRIAVQEASRRSWAGLIWASAASLILVAGLLLNGAKNGARPQPQADPDQELLLAIEHAVASDVPESLAPAALLAEDIRSAVESSSATPRNDKEKSNDN